MLVVLFGLIIFFSSSRVFANGTKLTGIGLTPSILSLNQNKNQNSITSSIQVTNLTNQNVRLKAEAQDFNTINDLGGINYFNPRASFQHDLGSVITFKNNPISLSPNSSTNFYFTINKLNNLVDGGHYDIIAFKLLPINSPSSKIRINQLVGTEVFLKTYFGTTIHLGLAIPVINYINFYKLNFLNTVLINTGNTQAIPRGIINIFNDKKQLIDHFLLNINSSYILPDSSRLFSFGIPSSINSFWPQEYSLTIKYRDSSQYNYQTYLTTFWTISPWFIVLIILLILSIGVILKLIINRRTKIKYLHKKIEL